MSRLLPFSHRVDHVHQSLDQFKLSSSPADSSGEGNQASLKRAIRHVRVVLDSGSHRSYITEQVAKDLSSQSEGKQSMTVMTFGSTTEQCHLCELVRLNIALKNGQQNSSSYSLSLSSVSPCLANLSLSARTLSTIS